MSHNFQFNKPTLITLTAPTASGKSFLLEALVKSGFERIVSTTTRNPRKGEREGIDYYFIDNERSKAIEANNGFAELVEFQGLRYGVTNEEFESKMGGEFAPIIILSPDGIAQYEHLCRSKGWNIFTVYVHLVESERIQRLNERTILDLHASVTSWSASYEAIDKIVRQHTKRIQGLMQDERLWANTRIWDAIVPGDDVDKAIGMIADGIRYRNQRISQLNK